MSKMACRCGALISDSRAPCPTEGWILREQDEEAFFGRAGRDITAFFVAVGAGRRTEWIAEFFSPQYPAEVGDEGIVQDILCRAKRDVFLSVAECERCGRLSVQRQPGVNSYRSWAPDEGAYAGALSSQANAGDELDVSPTR